MGKLVAPNPAYLFFLLPHLLPISVSYGDPHMFFSSGDKLLYHQAF